MTGRPPAVIGWGTPPVVSVPAGWTEIDLGALPAEPFDVRDRRVVAAVTVADASMAAAVVLAAARGVAVVVTVLLDGDEAAQFVEDLARVATVGPALTAAGELGSEHTALLDALAAGLTVTQAAERLGWSRRTATRRLTEARRYLGATSTAEALRLHRDAASHRQR